MKIRGQIFVGLVFAIVLLAIGFARAMHPTTGEGTVLRLVAPPLVRVASAVGEEVATFPQDEAGISAYFKAPTAVDLNEARRAFRTIEVETATYLIGSVPVTDYPESEDVHVYVHRDGWFLAYYLKADPVGKIFDWRRYTDTTIPTKLEAALAGVAGQAGAAFTGGTYYDFRYPNASHLMLIGDLLNNELNDTFEVNLPGSFAYYERSWSLAATSVGSGCYANYYLNEVQIHHFSMLWNTSQGFLTAAQLLPDTFHSIRISQTCTGVQAKTFGGLALVYRVP
jgi:hypothetical protein